MVVAAVLLAAVVYRAMSFQPGLPADMPEFDGNEYASRGVGTFESQSYYLDPIGARQLFEVAVVEKAPPEKKELTPEEREQQIRQRLEALKRSLTVVGLAWQPARVVMLYDQKNRNTYFLRESQLIPGTNARVENVTRDKVTITLQDEEITL